MVLIEKARDQRTPPSSSDSEEFTMEKDSEGNICLVRQGINLRIKLH